MDTSNNRTNSSNAKPGIEVGSSPPRKGGVEGFFSKFKPNPKGSRPRHERSRQNPQPNSLNTSGKENRDPESIQLSVDPIKKGPVNPMIAKKQTFISGVAMHVANCAYSNDVGEIEGYLNQEMQKLMNNPKYSDFFQEDGSVMDIEDFLDLVDSMTSPDAQEKRRIVKNVLLGYDCFSE